MEIAAFKVKSRNLPVLTFGYSDLNIWSYKSLIDTNLFFFWICDTKTYQLSKLQKQTMP